MDRDDVLYEQYLSILNHELMPAMGCTEAITCAYGAAYAQTLLGNPPLQVEVVVSANLYRNIENTLIPNTGGMHGIKPCIAAGLISGDHQQGVAILSSLAKEKQTVIKSYIEKNTININQKDTTNHLDFLITLKHDQEYVTVHSVAEPLNIVLVEKNGEVLFQKEVNALLKLDIVNRRILDIEKIVDFADHVAIEDIRDILALQMTFNSNIAEMGMNDTELLQIFDSFTKKDDVIVDRIKALTVAGANARMKGCELPVVLVSGSGNQGITASVPVIVYGQMSGYSIEAIYRALVVSNLTTIHLKTGMGYLSTSCGVVNAGAGSGAGICYLLGGDYMKIAKTISNTLEISAGLLCDGAKASCTAKIALAVESGLVGLNMAW